MIRFLRGNQFYIWIVFTIFYISFYLIDLVFPYENDINSIYPSLLNYLFVKINSIKLLSLSLALISNIFIANLLMTLSVEFLIIPGKNYFPVIFYYLFTGIIKFFHYFNPIHLSLILIVIILKNIFSSTKLTRFSTLFFDIGLLSGLSFLIYYPSWIFLLIITVGLLTFRNFIWREWITMFIGYLIPLLFFFTFNYFFDKEVNLILMYKAFLEEKFYASNMINSFMIYSLFISFIAMLYNANKIHTLKIQTRKTISFFIILFIILSSINFLLFIPFYSPILIILAIINFLFFTSFYFTTCNINRLNNILIIILLFSPLIIYFLEGIQVIK